MHLPKYEALKMVNRGFGTTIFIKVHKVKGQYKRRNQVDSVCDLVQSLGSSNDLRGEVVIQGLLKEKVTLKHYSTNLGTSKPGNCFELPSDWLLSY